MTPNASPGSKNGGVQEKNKKRKMAETTSGPMAKKPRAVDENACHVRIAPFSFSGFDLLDDVL